MAEATSDYWRKLIKIDEPVEHGFLRKFRSPLEVFRPLLFFIMDFLCRTYFHLKVYGIENIPADPPYIIAPNHVSALDHTMVSCAIGKRRREDMYTVSSRHFFDNPFARFFMRIGANLLRIDREEDFLPSLGEAAKVLKARKALYINPEGTRSLTGELLPFKVGVGVLAVEAGVPIVPVYIKGTHDALPPGRVIPRPGNVRIIFGEPVRMNGYVEKKRTGMAYDVYKEVTDELLKRVVSLKVRVENI